MNETKLLNHIFGYEKFWKNKYEVDWCDHCDEAIIICSECQNSSCNGGGCEKCKDDFTDFTKFAKHNVMSYLNEEEKKIYQKSLLIKSNILTTLRDGKYQINWKQLYEDGELSDNDAKLVL